MNAGELVSAAFKSATILGEGETLSAEQLADGLARLNDIISLYNTDSLVLYASENSTFTTVANQSRYTLDASGADWTTTRPVRINDAYITYQGITFPLEIINQQEYNDITLKTLANPLVRYLLYVNAYPQGVVYLWPVPSQALSITMTFDRYLSSLTSSTTIAYPPGYQKLLRLELAIELCPEYGKEPSQTLVARWKDAKASVKRANYTSTVSDFDSSLLNPVGGIAGFLSGY